MKQILIGVAVVIAIIGGAVVFGKEEQAVGTVSNHIYGKADSAVKLVEFGDFECPACKFYYPLVEQIKAKYQDKIAFQFMHFPLVQSHQNALAAHRSAEAAGKQGKFWEMYNKLYELQEDWNGPSQVDPVGITTDQAIKKFEDYAREIGLNIDQYNQDVVASATSDTINADVAFGKDNFQISGTPSFVLNGKKIEDLSTIDTLDEFSALIDQALADAGQTSTEQPAETKPEDTPTGE